jgi:hypothetical protein
MRRKELIFEREEELDLEMKQSSHEEVAMSCALQ